MTEAHLIEYVVRTGTVPTWYEDTEFVGICGHAIRRFVNATRTGLGGMDWAVLLRQCLRRLPNPERVRTARLDDPRAALLRAADVHQDLDGTLEAAPYRPSWVADLGDQSVDLPTMGTP